MTTLESEIKTNPENQEFDKEQAIADLRAYFDDDVTGEKRLKVDSVLLDLMNRDVLNPLSDADCIETIENEHPEVAELFSLIKRLSANKDFGEVPSIDQFDIIHEPYKGADGRERYPKPKFIPKHLSTPIKRMQEKFQKYLDDNPSLKGEHGRPGLVIQSAYRSHYYQLGIMARTMASKGLDYALSSVMVPGEVSDHANYNNCAVDIMVIGDQRGRVFDDEGREIDPSTTLEMQWIIQNAPNYGFYHPYPPKLEDPIGATGPKDILVEPWHIKFAFDSEVAADEGDKVHSREAFKKRAAMLGTWMLG